MDKSQELELLKDEVENAISLYESYLSGSAIRTRQMLERKGIVKALDELVQSPEYQKGFRMLHEHNQLDKSFEALVLKYNDLFSKNALACADFRLKNPDALKNIK